MKWVFSPRYIFSPSQQQFFLLSESISSSSRPPPPPPPLLVSNNNSFDIGNKISPSILLIIIILAVISFISGLLHLLVRFLFRPTTIRDPEDSDNVTALQGQLQQLFHLHDSGVDQSYIDTVLPVFFYNAIMGIKKHPFDCAVCLCEFEDDDKLRLLPQCSHAFHLECIDTWLLSHSTCPLCRSSLLADFSLNDNNCSPPLVYLLESGSESFREMPSTDHTDATAITNTTTSVLGLNSVEGRTSSNLGIHRENESGASCNDISKKFCEVVSSVGSVRLDEKVVSVKLGKFRNVDVAVGGGGGSTSSTNNSKIDSRRCFSMGSFEYVMDETWALQVSIRPLARKDTSSKKEMKPGYRSTMSECDGHSCREGFKGFEPNNKKISKENSVQRSKNESFSVSKVWLRTKKDKPSSIDDSTRRASSFRFAFSRTNNNNNNNTSSRSTSSEIDMGRWDNCVSDLDDEEVGSRNSLDSQSNLPSFARRTLLWLGGGGRQNKVVHSSPNV